jgi:aminopeptidase
VVYGVVIADVSERSPIEVDGDVVQRDGRFRWEPEFETA